ncbi:MAG: ferritin-like domain-containing protein [Patescibacteria group bacterium]|nr:ferritin-like domain-containing protein [Patescibacteria group bacterium]
MDHKDFLVHWLNKAFSIERSVIEILEKQKIQDRDYPALQELFSRHLTVANKRTELLEDCISRLNTETALGKSDLGRILKEFAYLKNDIAYDQQINDLIVGYALSCLETALYRTLLSISRHLGDMETASICQGILAEEKKLAQEADKQLPLVVQEILHKISQED